MTHDRFRKLQEAGTVLHLARSGRLILKASSSSPTEREGSILVDDKGRRSGRVLEIIGPVSAPYLSAQPFTDRIERIVGQKLYLSEDSPEERGERKRGGKGFSGNRKFGSPHEGAGGGKRGRPPSGRTGN